MNGRVLFDFMYDQFVWPKHPFASRDVRTTSSARGPQAEETASGRRSVESSVSAAPAPTGRQSPRAVIVLADRRRDKT